MRSIRDYEIQGKRVLVRVDFNVPVEGGVVRDDFRIRETLPTIHYLKDHGARTILLSHLGRPEEPTPSLSLRPVAKHLEALVGCPVLFLEDSVGERIQQEVRTMKDGDIALLENMRFYPEEEKNDPVFASRLAELGELYVNDAFGVSHRAHASIEAITHILSSCAGLLLEKEIEVLSRVLVNPQKPLAIIMGGAKVETKIRMLSRFFEKADNIMLGGIIANSILAVKGLSIGKSKTDERVREYLEGLDVWSPKIHLPVDVIVSRDMSGKEPSWVAAPGAINEGDFILDIGPDTVREYAQIIKSSKTVIWNGPMGLAEVPTFSRGTEGIAEALYSSAAYKVIGGGDVIGILDKMNALGTIDYVSTGGGAMLEFLAGEKLPGIEALKN